MQLNLKKTGRLLKSAFNEWWAKDPFKEGAAIAFYAVFSMPGLLVAIITISGYFFGADAVNNRLASQISSMESCLAGLNRFNYIVGGVFINDSLLRS